MDNQTTAIVTQEVEPKVLSATEIRQQVQVIQQIMRDEGIMQKGTHYGTIPGCGDKPTLLKAGAEKIMMTFRLAADLEIQDMSNADCIRYRIKTRIFSILTGNTVGYGIGEASTDESKYKWRGSVSDAEFNAADPERRRIKYFKRVPKSWADYSMDERREFITGSAKQVRTETADVANTVLKMAKKRSLVDGILTATAASDLFNQDLEDIPEENIQPKNVTPKADTPSTPKQAESQPAQPAQPKHIIGESVRSDMTDMMNEMAWDAHKQALAFQRTELVGEQAAMDGITAKYQKFLKVQKECVANGK